MSLRIGIAGAGIGGLAAAALLARAGHQVQVFDQFDAPRPVGSGLVIQPVGLAVLDALGAGQAARGLGARIVRMLGHEASGRRVLDVSYARKSVESYGLAIHRAALFGCIHDAAVAAGARVVASAKVLAAPLEAGSRWLETEAGRFGPFDLVVDAAGARSPLSPLSARPLGYGAIWGTVEWPDTPLPRDRLTQKYRRADRMAGVLPIGRRETGGPELAAVFWSLPRAAVEGWAKSDVGAWKAEATAFWPEFGAFLHSIRDTSYMTPAVYAHGTMTRPYGDRLVHLGDAAHRASPQLGQGANMALLDALALALAAKEGPDDAPAAYARMRRWHVRLYQVFSAAFTPQYQSDSRWLPVLRDRALFPLSQLPPLPKVLNRLVCGDLIPPLASQSFP